LTKETYCPIHTRPTAAKRGYGAWWRNRHKTGQADRFLLRNPLCARCKQQGKSVRATCVDHIIPHNGDQRLLRDESNWQALCASCHAIKTRVEQ
jgi:5-methylcytosine-specific restriction protein A